MKADKVIRELIALIDSYICLELAKSIEYNYKVFEKEIKYKGLTFLFRFKIKYLEWNYSKYSIDYIYVDKIFNEDNTEVKNSHLFTKDINNVLKYVGTEVDFINIYKHWKTWKTIMK